MEPQVPLRKAAVARQGRDLTIVTYGRSVRTALTAAEQLATGGVEAEIVDLRTVAPFDEETILQSVKKTRRLLVVHEAWEVGGIGAEIISRATQRAFASLASAPELVGAPAVPVPWAEPLRDALLPSVDRIMAAASRVLGA